MGPKKSNEKNRRVRYEQMREKCSRKASQKLILQSDTEKIIDLSSILKFDPMNPERSRYIKKSDHEASISVMRGSIISNSQSQSFFR